jgi:hypothetical protein
MRHLIALVLVAGCVPKATNGLNTGQTPNAVVTGRDDMNMAGSINTVNLMTMAITKAIDTTLDADHVVRASNARLFVLNRTSANVRIYDAVTFAVLAEIKAGDAGHPGPMGLPQDLYPVPGSTEIVITFAGNLSANAVGIVDSAQPAAGVVRWINVPTAAADPDGKPEPYPLHYCNGLFYAGLGDYNQNTDFAPTGPGRMAVLDINMPAAIGIIQLAHENPTTITQIGTDCNTVLVAGSGPFGVAPGAQSGVDKVILADRSANGLFDGATLMGVPNQITVIDPHFAIMVMSFDLQTVIGGGYQILAREKLVSFDPTSGAIRSDYSNPCGFIPFAAVAPNSNQLWFGNDNLPNVDTTGNMPPGVFVGPVTSMMGGPYSQLDIGQRPYTISFP